MPLKVDDRIEVRVNAVWKPAVVQQLFEDGDTDFFTAQFPDHRQQNIMLINEHSVWRHNDAFITS